MAVGLVLLTLNKQVRKCVADAAKSPAGPALHVLASTENLKTALRVAREFLPDIVLIDASTPDLDLPSACRQFLALQQNVKIVILASGIDDRELVRTLASGASGYIRERIAANVIQNCVETLLRNRLYIGPLTARDGHSSQAKPTAKAAEVLLQVLSDREIQVLMLITNGAKSREIASTLYISEKTVESHRRNIMRKLDIRSIADLTKFALSHGLTALLKD